MALDLQLDRDLLNTQFSSWRLQPLATVNRYHLPTTGHASETKLTSLDFLHTRASVLRNHLLVSEQRLFVFTQAESAPVYLVYELLPAPASDQGLLAQQVAEFGVDAGEEGVGGAVEAVVDCSLAVVAEGALPPPSPPLNPSVGGTAGPTASTSAAAAGCGSSMTQLLLSRGHGDVVLVRRRGGAVSYSNVVHPVRPRLPYTGVRPIILEAAVAHANGDITLVAWAMRSRGAEGGPAVTTACCELFAICLRPHGDGDAAAGEGSQAAATAPAPAAGALRLSTVSVRLIQRTKLPPYAVRVIAPGAAAPGAEGGSATGGEPLLLVAFDPNTADLDDDDEEMEAEAEGPKQARARGEAGDSGGRQAAAQGGGNDDDDDDMDPRTLEQAAARLAHMTGEERAGPQAADRWADIYKESGPDGVGAMGGEPCVDVAAWGLGTAGGSSGVDGRVLSPCWRLSCGAHRLLTAESAVRLSGRPSPPLEQQLHQHPLLLLGLTDDVDCAVVGVEGPGRGRAQAEAGQRQEQQPEVGEAQQDGDEHQLQGQEAKMDMTAAAEGPVRLQARHIVSMPALGYVAAGKTHKRHLLLATAPATAAAGATAAGSGGRTPVAAVLVENERFMYLYGSTTTRQEYGKQQVVELGLGEGETVLGARLVELTGRDREREQADGQALEAAPPAVLVVLATQLRLLSYRLRM